MKLKRLASCILVIAMSLNSLFAISVEVKAQEKSNILENPEITMNNLNVQSGTTDLLWNNILGESDFDFGPGGSNLKDSYIEYNYGNLVEIDGINFIGWWPKDQAVKEISVYYFKNSEWEPLEENVIVPWKTISGNGATSEFKNGEKLRIDFSEKVTTTKLKIKIHSTYTSWSSKINMRLMAPTGKIISNIKPIYDKIKKLESYVESVLIGDLPGEFPQLAVDTLNLVIDEVKAAADNGQLSEVQVQEAIIKLRDAEEEFLNSQNNISEENDSILLENFTIKSGNIKYLFDKQMSTAIELNETGTFTDSAIVFNYGEEKISLSEVKIICEDPLKSGIKNIDIEYFDGVEWKEAISDVELNWKGNFTNYEGKTVKLPNIIETSKVRLKVNESYSSSGYTKINEIIIGSNKVTNKENLQELVSRVKELLEKATNLNTAEVDLAKFKLISAQNEDTLSRATQFKIEYLYSELLAAANKIDVEVEDKIAPNAPYDVKVEKVSKNSVEFTFAPASDNIKVIGYKVYNGTDIIFEIENIPTEENRIKAEIAGLMEGTPYTFVVKAYDEAGNLSEGMSINFETESDEEPQEPENPQAPEEKPDKPENPQIPEEKPDNSEKEEQTSNIPNTGDTSNILLLLFIAFSSAIVIFKNKSNLKL